MQITFDTARPTRRSAAATQCGYSVIEDDGAVITDQGKTYAFTVCRIYDRRAPQGQRVTWDVELYQTNGRRLAPTALTAVKAELVAAFKDRVQADNAAAEDITPTQRLARDTAQVAKAEQEQRAARKYVVAFHHRTNPNRIHREVVEGATDCDQAASILLANTFSDLVIVSSHILDEGQQHPEVAEELPWVAIPDDRKAPYIYAAWSQQPCFGVGAAVSICQNVEGGQYEVRAAPGLIGTYSTLEAAQAFAQVFHDQAIVCQVVELRPGGYGYLEYLGGLLIDSLKDANGLSEDEVRERLAAGETLPITASFLRQGDVLQTETIKLVRIIRQPKAPEEPQDDVSLRSSALASYAASRNSISQVVAELVIPQAPRPFDAPSQQALDAACRGLDVIDEAAEPGARNPRHVPAVRKLTWSLVEDIACRNGLVSPHQVLKTLKTGGAIYTTFRRFYVANDVVGIERPEWMQSAIDLAWAHRAAQEAQERLKAAQAGYTTIHGPDESQEALEAPVRSCA